MTQVPVYGSLSGWTLSMVFEHLPHTQGPTFAEESHRNSRMIRNREDVARVGCRGPRYSETHQWPSLIPTARL